MKKGSILIFFLSILLFEGNAQTLNITLSQNANKEYFFILNRGINQDTIQHGNFDSSGNTTIDIPVKDKDYIGIGSLIVKDVPETNFIINHENFSVKQNSDGKYEFRNSPENTYLYSIIQGQPVPPVADTTLYAPHFVELIRFTGQLNGMVNKGADLTTRTNIKLYAVNKLDMERLYTSGLWYLVVDLLTKMSYDQEMMANDIVKIFERIKSQEIFEHLASNMVTILNQFGLDDAFDIIVPYLADSGRIETPQGAMYDAFTMAKIRKGTLVPPLEGLKPSLAESKAEKTLLVFYQPGCQNCELQMEELIENYPRLKAAGVRVVSISADMDKKTFEQDVKTFPWADKLCDFKGFAGNNFLNYGVLGAPTFYLLDKDSKMIKRFAFFADAKL